MFSLDCATFTSLLPLRSFVQFGSLLPAYGMSRLGSLTSAMDLVNLGSSTSLKSFLRSELGASIYGVMKLNSLLLVLDFLQLDFVPSPRSLI